ncbi:uncharacterized protein LOC125469474 [Pyrus x bretschneideri]|uniref:uncharacterized protein LOC125469474 n=1 Tax=Pyrus x bretschneideri TaxID=225117 RepID=UPI00202E46C2|nr:uncharacterized protein LOC125469474 [Pyrus x bretschneideri]
MRLDHDDFEEFVLSGKQGFTFSSEISLVEFLDDANAYVLPVSLTSFGLPIFVASKLVKEKYSCYFQKFLSMPFSLAVGTEPLDGLFTINSNPFQLETFENILLTWVTQPTARFLLDGMHYHGVLSKAFLSASQRLLQVIEVISKYMSPLVASYLAYANQIHVVLAFYIDSIGIITDFGKHFDGDEYVSWCHFNAKYNVDLMAALFMAHTTHIRLMERYFPDPTTSLPPAQVLPLHIWNEVLRSNFVLVDHFHHHGIWRVTLANMRAALDSAIWFSVFKGFTIIGWNHFTALVRVNMIHILYGEGIQPSLSRSVRGSNKTEWKRNDYLIRFFTSTYSRVMSPL